MGYTLDRPNEAARVIKELSNNLGTISDDVRVRVSRSPVKIEVEFLVPHDRYPTRIASFSLQQQIGCCGTLVSTETYVREQNRGQGLGQAMMDLKEAIAVQFGYSSMIASVVKGNLAEIHILEKRGWLKGFEFTNARTKNVVVYYFKKL